MTQNQTDATFDLDKAVNARVADYLDERAKQELEEDARRQKEVMERRHQCEVALVKAFPAELREALDMEVDERSVVDSISGYAVSVSNYPRAIFTLDDSLWSITLEYGNGVIINAPDGKDKQTHNNDENADALLLQIGLWRNREAERLRREQEEKEAQRRFLETKIELAPTATPEPAQPRMVGGTDPDDTDVVFILSERIGYYNTGLDQMQVVFSYHDVYLVHVAGSSKPRRFMLTTEQLDALIAARALYQQHADDVEKRRAERAKRVAEDDDIPF